MTTYYDVVLGLIPLALVGLGGGLQIVGVSQTTAILFGGIVAVALVGHALFVRGPVSLGRQPTAEYAEPTTAPINTVD